MIRNRFFLKFIAIFLIIESFLSAVHPLAVLALTAGPSAPEFSSFEPVDTSDIVNLASGQLVYNMPMLEIPGPEGGYPLSLSYHSGIMSEQEASWVGLGWTLSAGFINSSVDGIADDNVNARREVRDYWDGGLTTTKTTTLGISGMTKGNGGAGLSYTVAKTQVDKYLQEIGRVDLITADEEVKLTQRIKAGDQAALEKMVKANLRFVVSVAKQYQNLGLSLGDLINEGNIGLVKAAMRFDETRGFKFISYAVWWIRQSVMQAVAEQSRVVRIPLNRIGSLNKLNRTFSTLEQKFQRDPSAEELAEVLEVAPEEIRDTVQMGARQASINAPFVQGEENSLLDTLADESEDTPDSTLINNSLRRDVQRSLSTLTQRESDVISLYYGLNDRPAMTLEVGVKV